jgi:3-isopropylmalate/(R)-2-methylmalate dehydratase small subunit
MFTPATAGQPRAFAMTQEDLARRLFSTWRYDSQDIELPEFVLTRAPFRQARFLIAGANFGCGSSRDTAPRMLSAFGIRCIVASSFGGIFYDNCFKIGLLPMVVGSEAVESLAGEAAGGDQFTLNVAAKTITAPSGKTWHFELPSFRSEQLLTGADDIALTLRRSSEISAYQERERASRPWTFLTPK